MYKYECYGCHADIETSVKDSKICLPCLGNYDSYQIALKNSAADKSNQTADVAVKHDESKVRMDLISPIALEELANVLGFGAKKYAPWNWAKGLKYTRVLAAILRHTYAYLRGESIDPETGYSHMAAVMCNAMFILHYEKLRPECDDREKEAYETSKMSS